MTNNWQAGLTDQDDLSGFPSAANPLTALGIDPDLARANPELLAALRPSGSNGRTDLTPPPKPAPRSAVAAGVTGGAGDTSTQPATPSSATPAPTDAHGYAMEGLGYLGKALKGATDTAGEFSTEAPPEVSKLTAQRDKLAMPAPRFDPTTGKPLKTTQEYDPATGKMIDVNPQASTGQKVWRGVRGGLVGERAPSCHYLLWNSRKIFKKVTNDVIPK